MKPPSISDLAISTCAQQRWLKPTWRTTPALAQASTMRVAAARCRVESGFSQSTCLPRSAAAMTASAMIGVRRGDDHRVDVLALDQRGELAGMARDAEIRRERLGPAGVDVVDRRRAPRRPSAGWSGACDRRMIAPAPISPMRTGFSLGPAIFPPTNFLFSLSASEKAIGGLRARGQDWREDRCSAQASGGDALPMS